MSKLVDCLVLAVACCVGATHAHAALWRFDVAIDGLQVSPPVATPGFGTAEAMFDTVTGALDVDGTFQDLIGTTTVAHIHGYAPAGTPAGVVFGLTIPIGVTAGTISGGGIIPSDRIDDVLAGLTYINVHTSFRTGGEIRGQLVNPTLVPEPTTLMLSALALAGLFVLRRRVHGRA